MAEVISGSTDSETKTALDEIVDEYDEYTSRSSLVGEIAELVVQAESENDIRDPIAVIGDALDNESRQTAVDEYYPGTDDDVVLSADELAGSDIDDEVVIDPEDVDWESFHSGHSTELKIKTMIAVIRSEYKTVAIPDDRDHIRSEVMRYLGVGRQYADQYVDNILDYLTEVKPVGDQNARYVTREQYAADLNDGSGSSIEKEEARKTLGKIHGQDPEGIGDLIYDHIGNKHLGNLANGSAKLRRKLETAQEAGVYDDIGIDVDGMISALAELENSDVMEGNSSMRVSDNRVEDKIREVFDRHVEEPECFWN